MNYLIINVIVLLLFMNVQKNIYEPPNIKYDDSNKFMLLRRNNINHGTTTNNQHKL